MDGRKDQKQQEQHSEEGAGTKQQEQYKEEGIERARNFKGAVRQMFAYMGQYKTGLAVAGIFTVASTVFQVIGPKVLGIAITELSMGLMHKIQGTGGIDFGIVGRILLAVLLLYGLSSVFSAIEGWLMEGITQKVCYRLRREISEKINRMPMQYFEGRPYGEVLSRITNDVDTLGTGLSQSITQFINSTATLLGVLAMMLWISPFMTLIALAIFPLSVALVGFVVQKSQKYFQTQQEYLGHINGQIEENYSGHSVVRAFNREESTVREFVEKNDVLYDSAWKSQFLSGLMQPIMMFVGNLGYVGVAIAGGFLTIRGTIQVGDIQAFIQYVSQFTQPVQEMAQIINMLQSTAAAAERVFEFLAEEEEGQEVAHPAGIAEGNGSVCFEHVSFGYVKNQPIIKNFSFYVEPGQKIAVVGPTGAGKTTLVKLLMRFYDVGSGSVKLDGHDIREYDRRHLRGIFGMVLQDTWLFKGTVMENIRYGNLAATDEEVVAAAKAAHADSFIRTLPGGYQMEINEEASNISQGQKQLLTIARAILADNRILILDEATSSVDTYTEVQIQKAMDHLMQGRTSFIIAHRLSTVRNADCILVMKDGNIAEQGSHEELLQKNGVYAELYRSQFEMAG